MNAVIFDWDGTLADTKKAIVGSFQKVLRGVGCVVNDEFIERQIGTGTRNTLEAALERCNISPSSERLEKLVREKIKLQTEATEIVNLFEGTIDLLDALHRRTKVALATMSAKEVIDRLLMEKGIEKYFDAVVAADEVLKHKPDPEIFVICALKLNVDPEDCVAIEDSVFGVKAAKAARMNCIAIASGAYTEEELRNEKPNLLVSSIREKEKILEYVLSQS